MLRNDCRKKPRKGLDALAFYASAIICIAGATLVGGLFLYDDHWIERKYVCMNGKYYEEFPNGDLILQKANDYEPILCQG